MYERIKNYFQKDLNNSKEKTKKAKSNQSLMENRKWILLESKKEVVENRAKMVEEEENRKISDIQKNNMMRKINILSINKTLKNEMQNKIELEKEDGKALLAVLEVKSQNVKLVGLLIGTLVMISATVYYHLNGLSIVEGCILDFMAIFTCGMHTRKIVDEEEKFKESYPNHKELLMEKKRTLKKSLKLKQYQLQMHQSQVSKMERKNYRFMKSDNHVTKEQYRNMVKIKELSSLAKMPPLSIEELKKYREMLVLYQNQNCTNLENDKLNGKLMNNGLYNEIEYDFTINGVAKTKQLDKKMK